MIGTEHLKAPYPWALNQLPIALTICSPTIAPQQAKHFALRWGNQNFRSRYRNHLATGGLLGIGQHVQQVDGCLFNALPS